MLDRPKLSEKDLVTNTSKPARSFIAHAVPNPATGSGFIAEWAAPGMTPRTVLDTASGLPSEFQTEREAEAEARRVLFNVLNGGFRDKNKLAAYDKLTGPELAVLLAENDVSPTWFAFIMATNYARVMDWISGAQDVPHNARVLLEIFKRHPGAADTADEVTRSAASERVRRPSRQEQPEITESPDLGGMTRPVRR